MMEPPYDSPCIVVHTRKRVQSRQGGSSRQYTAMASELTLSSLAGYCLPPHCTTVFPPCRRYHLPRAARGCALAREPRKSDLCVSSLSLPLSYSQIDPVQCGNAQAWLKYLSTMTSLLSFYSAESHISASPPHPSVLASVTVALVGFLDVSKSSVVSMPKHPPPPKLISFLIPLKSGCYSSTRCGSSALRASFLKADTAFAVKMSRLNPSQCGQIKGLQRPPRPPDPFSASWYVFSLPYFATANQEDPRMT